MAKPVTTPSLIVLALCACLNLQGQAQTVPRKKVATDRQEQASALPPGGTAAIRVKCDGDSANARITVNGVYKGTCPMDLEVRPGTIVLQATKRIDDFYDRSFGTRFDIGADVARPVDVVFDPARTPDFNAEAAARMDQQIESEAAPKEAQRLRAMPALERAAASGDASAMATLGRIWELGLAGAVNFAKAISWYTRAADAGEASATSALAFLTIYGYGMPANSAKGESLLAEASKKGIPEAMAKMGEYYLTGASETIPEDGRQALDLLQAAAAQGMPVDSFFMTKAFKASSGNPAPKEFTVNAQRAEFLAIQKRAEVGENHDALFSAGVKLQKGGGGLEKNPELALKYCRMAFRIEKKRAATEDARSLRDLAADYDYGICTARDTFSAERIYRQAIDHGDQGAKWFLKELLQSTS